MEVSAENLKIQQYIQQLYAREDEGLLLAKSNSHSQGLPEIQVPAHNGKLLSLLTQIKRPRRILEIGSLGGYSSLWMARGLSEGGVVVSLEIDPLHALIARANVAKTPFAGRIEVREGDALFLLRKMKEEGEALFDMAFIDGDKKEYEAYLEGALQLMNKGALIVIDNLLPKGEEIGNPAPTNKEAVAIYRFNEVLAVHPCLDSVLITTLVGRKGRIDAMGIAVII